MPGPNPPVAPSPEGCEASVSSNPVSAQTKENALNCLDPFQLFSRTFRLWMYVVSHRALLLRSSRTDIEPSRIDVAFFQVEEVHLPTSLDSLEISAYSIESSTDVRRARRESNPESKVFRLQRGSDWYVIASVCSAAADDKGEFEPSQFSLPRLLWE